MKYAIIYVAVCCCLLTDCAGCAKSGRIRKTADPIVRSGATDSGRSGAIDSARAGGEPARESGARTTIRMEKRNGVYQIPVTINGSEMFFIFDTGAGMISISTVEATFLYKQGKLSDDDIIGKADFLDANGNISQDVIIRLKEVTIGNRTIHNIDASVVGNAKAPLLFGQSALEKFGKISIDYDRGEISFE